jgi:hypothetical protein
VLAQAEPALKKFFFQARAKILSVYVYISTHLHAIEGYLKIIALRGLFWDF